MAPRKPTWDWKARGCAEFKHFTVPFAVKEYVQNVVGQALKDLKTREWSDWTREDLRTLEPKDQEKRKQSLILEYPGLLTGPDGALLKRTKAWAPLYILSATIAQHKLTSIFATTDLKIALVVWRHKTFGITALSVYNNHLDKKARFSSFTVDGSSTSRDNQWAVGEKGKGFILATQYLFENVEDTVAENRKSDPEAWKSVKGTVSFRVGHQIGTLKWKKSRYDDEDDLLRVILDDLSPLSVEQYMDKQVADARDRKRDTYDDDDSEDDAEGYGYTAETPKLRKQAESALKSVHQRRITQQLDAKGEGDKRGHSLVSPDEVAITVIGLDGSFQPEYLFSAIYGIIPPPQQWRVPGSQVQFFIAAADETNADAAGPSKPNTKFYHRDQYVPFGLHLNRVSVNYHGDLSITSDRVAILRDHKMTAYRSGLSSSADAAIRTIPDLALELTLDILTQQHSEGFANLVRPQDKTGADGYRKAFEAAMRKLHPEIPDDARIHPTAGSVKDRMFAELGLTPVSVSSKAWEIIEASGAYVSLEDYARDVLLSSPPVGNSKGLARLRVAMAVVAPKVPAANVTIRDYNKSTPSVVWDEDNNLFAFALLPKCEAHPTSQCLCWVGPFLHDAAKDFDGVQLSTRKLFSAYLLCMKGDANMEDDESEDDHMRSVSDEEENGVNGMELDDLLDSASWFGSDSGSESDSDSPIPSASRRKSPSASKKSTTQRVRIPPPPRVDKPRSVRSSPRRTREEPRQATPVADVPRNPTSPPNDPPVNVAPASPTHIAAPSNAPRASLPASTATAVHTNEDNEDAALTAITTLVAAHKERKLALEEARVIMKNLQDQIDALRRHRDDADTQVDVLKIDCATHKLRIEELGRASAEKDAQILALQNKVKELNETEAGIEELLRARKKARFGA
ncbi:hypothetical protein C8R47DRAFT_1059787 [Mycena vitilis]|nr:hypothetical protein C8R47DRAFT_1059787 [Mycena vitilis]